MFFKIVRRLCVTVVLATIVSPALAERPLITNSEETATSLCKENERPYPELIQLCRQALTEFDHTDRDQAILRNNLGYALDQEDNYDLARPEFLAAIKLNPTYDAPLLNLGWAHWHRDEYDEAIVQFENAFKLNPSASALGGIASSLSHIGDDFDQAIAKIDQALLIERENSWFFVERAWILRRAGKHDQALEAFDTAIKKDGQYASAHYGRSLELSDRENWEEALNAINKAVLLNDAKASYMAERAFILRNLERPAQALRDADAALALDAENSMGSVQKSWSLLQLGRTKDAIDTIKEAAEADPKSGYLWFNYADILSEDEQWGRSLVAIDQTLSLEDADATDHNFRAFLLLRLDRSQEALASAKMALKLEPVYRWALFNAAYAYIDLDNNSSAYEYAQKALDAGLPEDDLSTLVGYSLRAGKFLLAGRLSLLSAKVDQN